MPELILSSSDFKALSSDTRVQIIKLLVERNYNISELSSKLSMSAPTIKQHLDVLQNCDLISLASDSSRKWKYYSLSRKGLKLVSKEDKNILVVLASSVIGVFALLFWFYSFFTQGTLSSTNLVSELPSISYDASESMVSAGAVKAIPVIQGIDLSLFALVVFVTALLVALFFHYKKPIR